MSRALPALLGIVLLSGACAPAALREEQPGRATQGGGQARVVRIAAAADLRFAMDELIEGWTAARPGEPVEAVYGSSGNFLAQIQQGAPFDVFFSADVDYARALEDAGLAGEGTTTRLYAIGRIVVWVPEGSEVDVETRGLEALTDPSIATVAIANPEHAPYGQAALAALESAGLYEAIEPKLVLGENIAQAAQFVESGSADSGIIALSLAVAPAMAAKGRYAIVPIDSYPRLEQAALVLRAARDPGAAAAFLDFVLGADGRAVLDRYGFLLPDP